MGQDHIGKSVERLLQSLEDLVGEQSGAAPGNSRPSDPLDAYSKEFNALEANWSRVLSRKGSIPQEARELAYSKTWIHAFLESKLSMRVGLVLAAVREQAEAATLGAGTVRGTTEASRCVAHLGKHRVHLLNNREHAMTLVAVARSLCSCAKSTLICNGRVCLTYLK